MSKTSKGVQLKICISKSARGVYRIKINSVYRIKIN
ncbi:hypothetical protein HKBW3S25_02040, partial [Candidatus Hakubella thermalkaliphila]